MGDFPERGGQLCPWPQIFIPSFIHLGGLTLPWPHPDPWEEACEWEDTSHLSLSSAKTLWEGACLWGAVTDIIHYSHIHIWNQTRSLTILKNHKHIQVECFYIHKWHTFIQTTGKLYAHLHNRKALMKTVEKLSHILVKCAHMHSWNALIYTNFLYKLLRSIHSFY